MRTVGLSVLLLVLGLPLASASAAPPKLPPGYDVDLSTADRCDPIDPARCLFPWPNDYFTRRDPGSDTGRRLALPLESMPANASGKHIDPSDWNRSDGFSPGSTIVVKVPGLDTPAAFERSGLVPVTDMRRAYARRQPVVVINARTRKRHLIWAELDSNAAKPEDTALLIRPGKNFKEGERYIVALRNLRGADGRRLPASDGFRLYRDRVRTRARVIERRRAHMERIFRTLRRAGIERRGLYLAWDFTVASGRSLAGRELAIRDDAFRLLGDTDLDDLKVSGRSPEFTVTKVTEFTPCEPGSCAPGQDPSVARRVEGRVTVPCYLNQPGCPPGSRFQLGPDGLPVRTPGNVHQANFICNVPHSASADRPARPSLYGHGLFGDAGEAGSTNVEQLGNENNVLVCAGDWIGMAEEDIPNALNALLDLSNFPSLPDRTQQGLVDFMYLGRLMIHPQGFASHPAFQREGRSLVDTRRLFYYGNSQGGILGGALTAVAPDFTRSVLYVGAMNYSVLVTRSVDFDPFSALLYPTYPDELERPMLLSLLQVLWDRGDPNGYAQHITREPYPNTPLHKVLMVLSFGDHQVANVQTEVEARTLRLRLREPATDPGRHTDVEPYFAIKRIRRLPYFGNALVVWDIGPRRPAGCVDDDPAPGQTECMGTPAPPITNTPPRLGVDPHDLVIESEARMRRQIAEFIKLDGKLIEVCGDDPCHAAGW
ncbi:MAG TPA: hypothetical protein VEQ61_08275 [Thermoleophilaceae bacterium]|nr:hypothetical protein [Thermoleophilaceae bacterium]